MELLKKYLKHISILSIIAVVVTLGELTEGFDTLADKYNTWRGHNEVELFSESSAIIGHRYDSDGLIYFRYRTCNPPFDAPMYYYTIYIDGQPVDVREPDEGHYDINTWFHPLQCTEGWWGRRGFTDVAEGSLVVITWYWEVNGEYDRTVMEYVVRNGK